MDIRRNRTTNYYTAAPKKFGTRVYDSGAPVVTHGCAADDMGRRSAYEAHEELLGILGVGVDVDLAFAGEPTESGDDFFFLELGFLLELLDAQGIGGVESIRRRLLFRSVLHS